jgi:Asp-tRNA(Asn)/Glu-tRNA(Gln) amidotransferase A subunit family amidase
MNLHKAKLTDAVAAIKSKRVSSVELVKGCLARIDEIDGSIEAWTYLNRENALKEAALADQKTGTGAPLGALHGVPIGVKDLFETAGMPTEYGSRLWEGNVPARDADAVVRLRAAGAVILGKTVTTEYAYYQPGKTRNPHDRERTPGGSSSGSAAAVAADMVPGAIGTQTTGSVIRPASFCGCVGYKPSFGLISRGGALMLSRSLDQVGAFARTVDDVALLASALMGSSERDPDAVDHSGAPLSPIADKSPKPRFAFVGTPVWDKAEADTVSGFTKLKDRLGAMVTDVEIDSSFAQAVDFQRIIMEVNIAKNFTKDLERGGDKLSQSLRDVILRGATHTPEMYQTALQRRPGYVDAIHKVLDQYDAIITPSVPGEAPIAVESTGSPIFCTIWSYLGTPAISLPLIQSSRGMPIGVQMIGKNGRDAELLSNAKWLFEFLQT